MVLLDLADSNWIPLLIVVIVLLAGAGLFFSMRHHIRKVDVPADHESEDASAERP